MPAALSLQHLSKTFPGQRALDDVDFEVRGGEVHCLLGQNGSGKSTLIKILAGYHTPDAGARGSFDGEEIDFAHGDAPWRKRLRFIHQDLGLVPSLNAIDNLALGRGFHTNRFGGIRWRAEADRAQRALAGFGVQLDVRQPVVRLSASERSMLAIVRALQDLDDEHFTVLILDEPTSSLPQPEVDRLFTAVRSVRDRGAGVVFVTHRLPEVFAIGDRVSVLRDGRCVGSRDVAALTSDELVSMIVVGGLDKASRAQSSPGADVVIRVARLAGQSVVDVSFEVHRGEILGIAGLDGSGRDELAGLIFGSRVRTSGEVRVDGTALPRGDVRKAMAAGVAHVPASRAVEGIIPAFAVRENVSLAHLGPLTRRWRVDRGDEHREVMAWATKLGVRPLEIERPVATLSGGNQQKVVLAKWLRGKPALLVLDEPTQGVDVSAKSQIYGVLAAGAVDGIATIVCSNDAAELVAICDRVLVLRDGRVAATLAGADLSEERIAAEVLRSERRPRPDGAEGGHDAGIRG